MDSRLKKRAAVVMYSGRKLYEEAEIDHRYFLEQAVDYERFADLPAGTPADIAAIPRPVLGYVGAADLVHDGRRADRARSQGAARLALGVHRLEIERGAALCTEYSFSRVQALRGVFRTITSKLTCACFRGCRTMRLPTNGSAIKVRE